MIYLIGGKKVTNRKREKSYHAEVECDGRKRLLYRPLKTKTASLKYGLAVVTRYKRLENYERLKKVTAHDNGAGDPETIAPVIPA